MQRLLRLRPRAPPQSLLLPSSSLTTTSLIFKPTTAAFTSRRTLTTTLHTTPQRPHLSSTPTHNLTIPYNPSTSPPLTTPFQPTTTPSLNPLQQVRCGPRNTMNGWTHLIRKRRLGFLARLRSKTGRKILKRKRAKGKRVLSF